jgi:short-subunit dehydrogenase
MKWLLVLGAESDIAKAVVRRFAKEGVNFYLAHFNIKEIVDFAKDVEIRFDVKAIPVEFDAVKFATHQKFYEKLKNIF